MSADELMKINPSAPPLLYRKASNIHISLIRHKSKAAAELHRREIHNRIQQLELLQKEAALTAPSTSKTPTPAEEAAAAAAAEKERREAAKYAADLAEWQKRYDDAVENYKAVCAEYDVRRDALATVIFEGKGQFFASKESLPEFVLACVDEYITTTP